MPQITLNIPVNVAQLLDKLAARFNQTPEQIAEQILINNERVMNPLPPDPIREAAFRAAVAASLEANVELYRRLANAPDHIVGEAS